MKLWILWGAFALVLVLECVGIRKLFVWCDNQPSDFFAAGIIFWMAVIGCVIADVIFFAVNAMQTLSHLLDHAWH